MRKLLIATTAAIGLLAAPLAAQAATSSSTSSGMGHVSKHATVRTHTAKSEAPRHHTAMSQKKVNCPPGSQNPACHPTTTGTVR
jgi:hypothetical protein